MTPEDEAVLKAAERWFRELLRLEKLWPHEKELFKALAARRQARGAPSEVDIPKAPKVPVIELPEVPPGPKTLKDLPSFQVDPSPISSTRVVESDDLLTISTKPLPPSEQERLIERMLQDARR